jgi:hypothetical protein
VQIGIFYLAKRVEHDPFIQLRHARIMPKRCDLCRTAGLRVVSL